MSKTYRRPPIKQHRELEEAKYRSRMESDKRDKKSKHPSRDFTKEMAVDWGFEEEEKGE